MADLAFAPCHRQLYNHMLSGQFKVENGRIAGVIAHNPEMWIAQLSTTHRVFPYCEQCLIKHVCSGGCLGAQMETTGDNFTPIPSVCRLEHEKIRAMASKYQELGVFDDLMSAIAPVKRIAFREVII